MHLVAVILVLPTLAAVATAVRRRAPHLPVVIGERTVHFPTLPGWTTDELLDASTCIVLDVVITDIVTVDHDLLVAFAGGPGSWYLPGDASVEPIGLVRPVSWVEATIALQARLPLDRRRAVDTLTRWRVTAAELQAFASVQLGLVGLINPATGEIFATPLASQVTGRV